MPWSAPLSLHRPPVTPALLGSILIGFVAACARPTTASRTDPEAAPPAETTTAADLTSDVVEKRPQEPLSSLLGRASGVLVNVNPDGSISVRIRAASSFLAGTEPLYVIDGSPVTPEPGGTLRGITPHDIQSIEVLKNPGETALYGVRGANGVILITTKRPRQ